MTLALFLLFQFLFLQILLHYSNHSLIANVALKQQVLVLKERNKKKKIKFGILFITFWILLKIILKNWKENLFLVKPETVVSWHRNLFVIYWSHISKVFFRNRAGRKNIIKEIRELILKIKAENVNWGATKIHAELLHLGFKVSERSVSRYLKKLFPNNKARQSWKTFLANHADNIVAMDFLVSYTWNFKTLYSFFIISHATREIIHFSFLEAFSPLSLCCFEKTAQGLSMFIFFCKKK